MQPKRLQPGPCWLFIDCRRACHCAAFLILGVLVPGGYLINDIAESRRPIASMNEQSPRSLSSSPCEISASAATLCSPHAGP
jgi:hypothetical protein